jgi:hypothetical protein
VKRYKVSVPVAVKAVGGYRRKRVTVTVDAENDAEAFRAAYRKRSEAGHLDTLPNARGQEYKVLSHKELP